VRVEGLEPPYLAAPDPKSGVSTNFTTPALHLICPSWQPLSSNRSANVGINHEKNSLFSKLSNFVFEWIL